MPPCQTKDRVTLQNAYRNLPVMLGRVQVVQLFIAKFLEEIFDASRLVVVYQVFTPG